MPKIKQHFVRLEATATVDYEPRAGFYFPLHRRVNQTMTRAGLTVGNLLVSSAAVTARLHLASPASEVNLADETLIQEKTIHRDQYTARTPLHNYYLRRLSLLILLFRQAHRVFGSLLTLAPGPTRLRNSISMNSSTRRLHRHEVIIHTLGNTR